MIAIDGVYAGAQCLVEVGQSHDLVEGGGGGGGGGCGEGRGGVWGGDRINSGRKFFIYAVSLLSKHSQFLKLISLGMRLWIWPAQLVTLPS